MYIDNNADVSFAFIVNEEENSSKNQVECEYIIERNHHISQYSSIHFLQEQENWHSYIEDYHDVFLDIISPPPQPFV